MFALFYVEMFEQLLKTHDNYTIGFWFFQIPLQGHSFKIIIALT